MSARISNRFWVVCVFVAVLAAAPMVTSWLGGSDRALAGPGDRSAMAGGKDVAVSGSIVDLHCFITGDYPSADRTKCTADCIREGVPVGLQTADGVIILGYGMKSVSKLAQPFAMQEVTVHGKMFDKAGIKYIDVTSIEPAGDDPAEEGGDADWDQ